MILIEILRKYYTDLNDYQGINILNIDIFKTYFHWFTDCGEWFIYIGYKEHGVRFSSCGFMRY